MVRRGARQQLMLGLTIARGRRQPRLQLGQTNRELRRDFGSGQGIAQRGRVGDGHGAQAVLDLVQRMAALAELVAVGAALGQGRFQVLGRRLQRQHGLGIGAQGFHCRQFAVDTERAHAGRQLRRQAGLVGLERVTLTAPFALHRDVLVLCIDLAGLRQHPLVRAILRHSALQASDRPLQVDQAAGNVVDVGQGLLGLVDEAGPQIRQPRQGVTQPLQLVKGADHG